MLAYSNSSFIPKSPDLIHISKDKEGVKKVCEPPKLLKWLRDRIPEAEGLRLRNLPSMEISQRLVTARLSFLLVREPGSERKKV